MTTTCRARPPPTWRPTPSASRPAGTRSAPPGRPPAAITIPITRSSTAIGLPRCRWTRARRRPTTPPRGPRGRTWETSTSAATRSPCSSPGVFLFFGGCRRRADPAAPGGPWHGRQLPRREHLADDRRGRSGLVLPERAGPQRRPRQPGQRRQHANAATSPSQIVQVLRPMGWRSVCRDSRSTSSGVQTAWRPAAR